MISKRVPAESTLDGFPFVHPRIAVSAFEIDETDHTVALAPMERTSPITRELFDEPHRGIAVRAADQHDLDHAAGLEPLHAKDSGSPARDPQGNPAGGENFGFAVHALIASRKHRVHKRDCVG